MVFHDEDAIADVVNATVHTMREATFQIGKAERGLSAGQIARMEEAIAELQRAMHTRKRPRSASRP
jgi:hypothetical protein